MGSYYDNDINALIRTGKAKEQLTLGINVEGGLQ